MDKQSSIIIYTTEDGTTNLQVKMENETVWLNTNQMAELFGRDRTVITKHINNCFREGELDRNITCAKFAHMGKDGDQIYETTMYNLDVIISVGYRVKSINGTRFMSRAITLQEKATETEYSGLFNVIIDYVYALDTLDRYDYQTLSIESTTKKEPFRATY